MPALSKATINRAIAQAREKSEQNSKFKPGFPSGIFNVTVGEVGLNTTGDKASLYFDYVDPTDQYNKLRDFFRIDDADSQNGEPSEAVMKGLTKLAGRMEKSFPNRAITGAETNEVFKQQFMSLVGQRLKVAVRNNDAVFDKRDGTLGRGPQPFIFFTGCFDEDMKDMSAADKALIPMSADDQRRWDAQNGQAAAPVAQTAQGASTPPADAPEENLFP